MIEDLEKYLKVSTKGKKLEEKIEIIEEKLLSKLYNDSDYFKFIALYGIFSCIKIYSIWPCTLLNNEVNEYFDYFLNYLNNKKDEEYFESIREDFP